MLYFTIQKLMGSSLLLTKYCFETWDIFRSSGSKCQVWTNLADILAGFICLIRVGLGRSFERIVGLEKNYLKK